MNQVASISEVVGLSGTGASEHEICATADADFNEATSIMTVRLGCFIRPVDLLQPEKHLQPDWLPHGQIVREHVAREEAVELARDIFQAWVRQVRKSITGESTQ